MDYHPEKCDFCGECLAGCRHIGIDPQEAAEAVKELAAGKTPEWLKNCVTCFSCNERCKKGANPFFLVAKRIEQAGACLPPELTSAMHAHFSAKPGFTPSPVEGRALSLCTIYSVLPPDTFTGKLFDGMPQLKGRGFFCHLLHMHTGGLSFSERELGPFIQRLAATGAPEIVFAHDDCYAMVKLALEAKIPVPFKPVHILTHLRDYLAANRSGIRPLNKTVAYQRPCASRFSPEKENLVDEIFGLIGATRAIRAYDREKALCCGENGGGAIPARAAMGKWKERNIADAKGAGAEVMACLCPMCVGSLKEEADKAGLPLVFLVDLVKTAIGEK
ncbi:MAG: heterodisulfide reductase-related iron-sulfur binding cluster [Thermodesulfobacteriota bacterium]